MLKVTKEKLKAISLDNFLAFFNTHTREEIYAAFNLTEHEYYEYLKLHNITVAKKQVHKEKLSIDKQAFKEACLTYNRDELCRLFNISPATVTRYKKQLGLTNVVTNSTKKLAKLNLMEVLNYNKTHKTVETCAKFNISTYEFYKYKKQTAIKNKTHHVEFVIPEETFTNYALQHTIKETKQYFNITTYAYNCYVKFYNLESKRKINQNKLKAFLLTNSGTNYTISELADKFNLSRSYVALYTRQQNYRTNIIYDKSTYEKEIINFLNSLNIKFIHNDRTILNGQELDFYCPNEKVAIEFNGNFWHSSLKKEKTYHYKKSKACEEKGIRLIHIYEHQWQNSIKQAILKSIIKNALKLNSNFIYARKCKIKELSKKDVEEFSNLNSLHGHRNASIYLWLFYNDELVELMSFGHPYFAKDKTINYECIRSITKLDTTVVGGMNKLFTYFIANYTPDKILYYVDYNTHNGNSMQKLNFRLESYSKYGVINIAIDKAITQQYGQVFGRMPSKNKEIKQAILDGKILSVYDAGVKKYIWTK